MLDVSISQHLAETTEEQATQQGVEFLVRSSRILNPMIMSSLLLVITTIAGILLGIPMVCGATPLILTKEHNTVRSPFALL